MGIPEGKEKERDRQTNFRHQTTDPGNSKKTKQD